jgi:hypothetical protein
MLQVIHLTSGARVNSRCVYGMLPKRYVRRDADAANALCALYRTTGPSLN